MASARKVEGREVDEEEEKEKEGEIQRSEMVEEGVKGSSQVCRRSE